MDITITEITPTDDQDICHIIKSVGAEFGAVGEGFGPSDAEVEQMSQYYGIETKSIYLVAKMDGKVMGGAGIAAFNSSQEVCELKKLFLLPERRGHGLGIKLSKTCMKYAKDMGYQSCYLDTLSNMTSAIRLYEKLGFSHLNEPMVGTEHNGCDVWMIKEL
ncbi:GNAT family N-acetyltransferase [Vibrio sp. 1180_3]|uniref:GNAT family N-acetyltransferase n=1 Tax=Vibrio sp. 1180_3 TaxID=2528832 RepID=UPI0024052458|nr:GNAT family N-acetyltransferase [Vibrio sp. 1180_3]MDF9398781.1 GNAT family N-acetyltransferase [Vibrio sp. 1180_3]